MGPRVLALDRGIHKETKICGCRSKNAFFQKTFSLAKKNSGRMWALGFKFSF